MKSPFEDTGMEDALTEVEFTLNVFCSQDNTLSVTSNDLVLSDPDIRPVGELPNCLVGGHLSAGQSSFQPACPSAFWLLLN